VGRSPPPPHPHSSWRPRVYCRRPAPAAKCLPTRAAKRGREWLEVARGRTMNQERRLCWGLSTHGTPGYCHTQPPTTPDQCRQETAQTRDVRAKRSVLLAISRTHVARSGTLMRVRDCRELPSTSAVTQIERCQVRARNVVFYALRPRKAASASALVAFGGAGCSKPNGLLVSSPRNAGWMKKRAPSSSSTARSGSRSVD
jgi:hypothetical protein